MKDGLTIDANGTKCWYLDGKRHRVDGPAIEWANGTKRWYLDGKRHRIDGPAEEYANGTKRWYLDGNKVDCQTQEQFLHMMKMKAFW